MAERFGKYEFFLDRQLGNTNVPSSEGKVYEGRDTEVGCTAYPLPSRRLNHEAPTRGLLFSDEHGGGREDRYSTGPHLEAFPQRTASTVGMLAGAQFRIHSV